MILSPVLLTGEENTPSPEKLGVAACDGKTSAAAIAWATLGIGFLIAIGIVIAISLSKDNKH